MTRVRVFDNFEGYSVYPFKDVFNDEVLAEYDVSYSSAYVYAEMHDVVTPNYWSRQAAGEIIMNPLALVRRWRNTAPAPFVRTTTVSDNVRVATSARIADVPIDGFAPGSAEFDSYFDSFATEQGQAVAEAFANVDESAIMLGASLGELPETVGFMCSLYVRFIKAVRLFKSKQARLQMMRRLLKMTNAQLAAEMSKLWLELRFAVRPLVFDMHNALKAFAKELDTDNRLTARGQSSTSVTIEDDPVVTEGVYTSSTVTKTTTLAYKARAGVLYHAVGDARPVTTIWGLDLPLETAWELIPFSFIVDWFFNVGDIVAAWSKNASLATLGSWVTEEIIIDSANDISVSAGTDPNSSVVSSTGKTSVQMILKRRIIDPPRPLVPSINVNLDVTKLIDLGTIAYGLFRSIRR